MGELMKELLWRRKKGFLIYVTACFISVIMNFLQMAMWGIIFNALEKGSNGAFLRAIGLSMLCIVAIVLLYILSRMMRIGYMRDILLDMRKNIFESVMNKSYKEFSKQSKEVYISNLSNDINLIESKFFISLLNAIFKGGLYVSVFIILCIMDYKLALSMGGVSIIILGFGRLFTQKTAHLQENLSKANEGFTVEMSSTFNGLEIIKLNQIQGKFLDKNLEALNHVEKRKFDFNLYTDLQKNIFVFSGYVAMVGIIIYLGTLVSQGVGMGKIMILFYLSNSMIFPLLDFFPLINIIKASAQTYKKIVGDESGLEEKQELQSPFNFNEMIEAKNITFSYGDQAILKNANFSIQKGKKYLIKGPSGAGKSTLIKLLTMVYDDYTGSLLADEKDYKKISEKSFNNKIAFIYQDVFLFEDTIRNNITLYQEMDEERVKRAVKASGLVDLIDKRPEGLEEVLMENGKNLSGGQRQRISIARAIAKEAEILFIDEGTSSLNPELGKQIEETFLELPSTVIAISHRYYEGVTEQYDYVLELKNGNITQYDAKDYFEGTVKAC